MHDVSVCRIQKIKYLVYLPRSQMPRLGVKSFMVTRVTSHTMFASLAVVHDTDKATQITATPVSGRSTQTPSRDPYPVYVC